MSDFDPAAYFAKRSYAEELSKIQALQDASAEKTAALGAMRQAREASIAANADSWASKLGLDAGGVVGGTVNAAASFGSGLTRVAGQVAALPANVGAIADTLGMDQGDYAAMERYNKGVATAEDMLFLNSRVDDQGTTKLNLFQRSDNQRQLGQDIAKRFDTSGIVHQDKRQELVKALSSDFQGNWDQVTGGWDKAKGGKVASGAGDIAAGLAKLIYNAGDAAVNNKQAAGEYILENIPQLLGGLAGRSGLLTASNVGYATDNYNQGIQKYQAANNGAYPPEAERQKMAMLSASLALAEHAGELGQLKALLPVKAANDVSRSALKTALNIGKATALGVASEAPTEGYQTWAEGEITGKPASPLEIYQGAAIGGIAGGGMSGGGRVISELTQTTPEDAARAAKVIEEKTVLKAAIVANDTTTYLDPESKNYDPAKAVQVLHGNSGLKDTTEEAKQENLTQARTIVTNFQDTVDEAKDSYRFMKLPEEAKTAELTKLKEKIAALDPADTFLKEAYDKQLTTFEGLQGPVSNRDLKTRAAEVSMMISQLNTARSTQEDLASRIQQVTPESVKSTIDLANTTVDPQDTVAVEASQKAVKTLLNLSMLNTSHLSADTALELVDNKGNALTEPQRDYLREFSKARLAENQLMSMGKVSQTIMTGDGKNLGIKDYRTTIGQALEASDKKTADKHMELLKDFAAGHQNKATAFQTAYDNVTGYEPIQVIATKNKGEWVQNTGVLLNDKQLRANGGANIHKGSTELLSNVKKESAALNQAVTEQNAAYALVYPTKQANVAATVAPVVAPSATSAPLATASPAPGATVASVAPPTIPADTTNAGGKATAAAPTAVVGGAVTKEELTTTPAEYSEAVRVQESSNEDDLDNASERILRLVRALNDDEKITVVPASAKHGVQSASPPLSETNLPKKNVEVGVRSEQASEPSLKEEVTAQEENAVVAGLDESITLEDIIALEQEELNAAAQTTQASDGNSSQEASVPGSAEDTASGEQAQGAEADQGNQDGQARQSGKLAAVGVASEKDTPYKLRKLIGDYFTQKSGNERDATLRPLVEIKDFLSALVSDAGLVAEFVKDKASEMELTDKQANVINLFKRKATAWNARFQKSLVKGYVTKDGTVKSNDAFKFKDLMQFLITEMVDKDGNQVLDLEENLKTAMSFSAFSWIAENAGKSQYNTPAEINAILMRDEDEVPTPTEFKKFGLIGVRENVVRNGLGQKAIAALGLSVKSNAPKDLMPRLESAMGAYIQKILMEGKEPILVRTTISGEQMRQMTGNKKTDIKASFQFLKLARDEEGKVLPEAEAIYQANKGTQGILNKLFSVESGLKDPSLEPIPVKQKTTKNTEQGIPSLLAKIIEKENAEANYIRQDMWSLLGMLDEATVMAMAGVKSVDKATTHLMNRGSIQAKNDGLQREYAQFMDYVGAMKDNTVALFFDHSVWKQQRVGITTNTINPQTSKFHRFMLYRQAWETKVDPADLDMMENFRLRVMEGLGTKTDKQSNDTTMTQYEKTVMNPVIQDAVEVLVKTVMQGQEMTAEGQQILAKAVDQGGSNFHSLDALMALAHEKFANGKPFTVQMMGEVDGVTNGPMLTHLLMGAAGSVKDLFGLLKRGGFFEKGNAHSQYNLWRGSVDENGQPHTDLYETTTRHMVQTIRRMVGTSETRELTMKAIYAFTGELTDAVTGNVVKAGRNIIKTPLTAMVFGSSLDTSIGNMANNFIEAIYESVEKLNEKQGDPAELIANLNRLLGKDNEIRTNSTLEELMETEFTYGQTEALKNIFQATLGVAVKETMEKDFETFIASRKTFNQAAKISFDLYNAAYTGMRETYINELMDKGEIDFTETNKPTAKNPDNVMVREPNHSLTAKQEEALQERMSAITPLLNTLMSKESHEPKNGLLIAKTERKLSEQGTYKGSVKFGTPFADGDSTSANTTGYERVQRDPGVAMLPMSMHSTDSYISHMAARLGEVLNVHDAHGAGLATFEQTARNLNEATWNAMLAYSPFEEMQASLSNVVLGLDALLKAGNVPPAVFANLNEVMKGIRKPKGTSTADALLNAASELAEDAYRADTIKYGALAELGYVDQYALEGGNYEVTDAQRAEAAAKAAALTWTLPSEVKDAIQSIMKQLASAPKVAQTTGFEVSTQEDLDVVEKAAPATSFAKIIDTVWGQVGNPTIPSDPALVEMFQAKPVMSAREVVSILQNMLNNGVANNKNLIRTGILERVAKLVPADLKVRYVTPTTAERDVLDKNAEGARGWYVSTVDGKQEIYVLSSDFKQSGLTAELLLHELLHGVLAQTIQQELAAKEANPEYTSDAYLLVQDLETLLGKAQSFVEKNKLSQFKDAVSNVHELVSWGMTNLAFQKEVLNQVTLQSKTRKNALVTGMKEFIQTLTGLLFKGSDKSRQAIAVNGMSVLFSNVTGLLAQAEQNKAKGQATNLSMAAGLNTYTTADIHAALSTGAVSEAFDTHLREVITNITEKLQGPFGAFREAISRETVKNQADVFTLALATGVAPFAFKALYSPFKFSNQEAFVAEMVAVTVQTAMDDNAGDTSSVYSELRRQFDESRRKLKPSDFDADPVIGQEKYDFIFNRIDKTPEGMSQQLAQFAAMGMAHEGFNKLLQTPSDKAPGILVDRTFLGALRRTFEKALEWFNGKKTHTYAGQPVDSKLVSLVSQLVAIENKKLALLENDGRTVFTPVEEGAEKVAEAARKKLSEFGRSKFFKKSKYGVMRGTGAVISIVAEDRVKQIMAGVNKMREEHFEGIQGVAAGIATYMKGPKQAFGVLLQIRKHIEGKRKSIISETSKGILGSFVNEGKDLSREAKGSLTSVLLRTGAHVLLGTYDYKELQGIVSNDQQLQAAVKVEETALRQFPNRFRNEFLDQSRVLAYHLATGKVAGQHLLKNADNIARMLGTSLKGRLTEAETQEAAKIIDRLTTLYSIGYLDTHHRDAVAGVMGIENARTDKGNGIEALLKLHKFLDKDSADRLFSGNEALMAKGYTPEIYNPHTGIKVANEFEGAKLIALGYTKIESVLTDPDDIAGDSRHLYAMRDGGLPSWLSGTLSLTGMRATGTKHHSDHAFAQQRALTSAKQAAWMTRANPGQYDPAAVKAQYMAPVFNGAGDAVNYAYLMVDTTKDNVLERDNRFDEILGVLAGNIYDKETTAENNHKVIEALHTEYLESYSESPKSFVVVGANSTDPELRELYQMLPKVTRDAILAIWGTNGMKVRADMLDINFGYRKLSISTVFDKAQEDRNAADKLFTFMVESFLNTYGRVMTKRNPANAAQYANYGKRAAMVVRRSERIWQTLVAETKDNFVVKSGTALVSNTMSNFTLLKLWGVSNAEMLKYHQVAYKGAEDYQRDNSELMQLEMSLNTGYVTGDVAEVAQRIEHLKDALLRNPVRDLIEKGLMPSIVEDVSTEEDIYSYKAEFARNTEKFTKKLNHKVIDVARTVYMAHDTQMYKTLNHLTQLSDFTARYTLYQHLTTRKKNPMTADQAIKEATDSFVNYDIPMHRKMQYSDDMGFTMFTKYFLSIQRILLQRTRENPGRVMMLLTLQHYFDWLPTVTESSFMSHIGNNPLNLGALKFPTSLDDLATMKMGLSLFK